MAEMEITREEAISECQKMWEEIAASGLSKHGFLDTPEGIEWRQKGYFNSCPLCELAREWEIIDCGECLLPQSVVMAYRCYRFLGYSLFGVPSDGWLKVIRELR